MKKYAVVDSGASGGRVLCGGFDGNKIVLEPVYRFPVNLVRLKDDLYWDILGVYSEIKAGLKAFKQLHGVPDGLGIDTWGCDYGLLDARGQLTGNPHCYRDPRTNGMMKKVNSIIPEREIFNRTANCPSPVNTLYHLAGMVDYDDPALQTAKTLLMIPDLLNYFLTGEISSEYTNASTTQFFSPMKKDWDYDLLKALSLPYQLLAKIEPPGREVGQLLPYVAQEIGMNTRVNSVASHDTASAILSVIPSAKSSAYLSCGTWCILGIVSDTPILTDDFYINRLTNESTFQGTYRPAKNINGLWVLQECKRQYEAEHGEISWEECTELASAAKPFQAVIDPDDNLFFGAGGMLTRIRDYLKATGQSVPDDFGGILRVVNESLALKFTWTMRQVENATKRPLEVLDAVGGGTRNSLLMQLTADASGIPVSIGAVEGTATGNLMAQLIASKAAGSLSEAEDIVRRSFPPQRFEPKLAPEWDDAYAKQLRLIERSNAGQ